MLQKVAQNPSPHPLNSKFGAITTPYELEVLGHNHTLTGLFMRLEAYNHMEGFSCMRLGAHVTKTII